VKGCLESFNWAQRARELRRWVDARSYFVACTNEVCPSDFRRECFQRVEDLNRAIPTVVIDVADAAGSPVSGATIAVDGASNPRTLDGTAFSVDPGWHLLTVGGAGKSVTKKVETLEGVKAAKLHVVLR
jgi:hypothetical protein